MTTDMTPRGPFNSIEDVSESVAPLRAAVSAVRASDRLADQIRHRRIVVRSEYIANTLTACGVELGDLDQRAVRWLAAAADTEEIVILLDWLLRVRAVALAEPPVYGSIEEVLGGLDDAPPADPATWRHALTPAYSCGDAGPTAAYGSDVTCPKCLAIMARDRGQR